MDLVFVAAGLLGAILVSFIISRYWRAKAQFHVNRHIYCVLCGVGIACVFAVGMLAWAYVNRHMPGYAINGGAINALAFASVQIGLGGIFLAYMATLEPKK